MNLMIFQAKRKTKMIVKSIILGKNQMALLILLMFRDSFLEESVQDFGYSGNI